MNVRVGEVPDHPAVDAGRSGTTPSRPVGERRAVHPARAATIAARLLAILSLVVAALAIVLGVENGKSLADLALQNELAPLVLSCGLAIVGALVIAQNPRNALAWLFCAQGQLQAWSAFGAEYVTRDPHAAGAGVAAFLGAYLWMPGMIMLLVLTIPLFPDGRPPSRRWWPLVIAGIVVTAVATVGMLLTDAPLNELTPLYHNPLALGPAAEPVLESLAGVLFAAAVLLALIGIVCTIVRAVRTTGVQRGQSIALVSAFGVGVIGQALNEVSPAITAVAWTVFVAALGAAMLRGGLYEGDRVLNRSLLYAVCTAVVAAVVGLAAGLLGEAVGGAALGAVVAAVIVALAIDPVRRAIQRTVDSILFGARRDPFAAVEALGARLASTLAPEEALATVVETVTSALRLPAASVTLMGEETPAAAAGSMPDNHVDLPLKHSGADVGMLRVGLPGSRRFLDPQDERLLTELARQAGAAADAVRLTRELRRSRDAVLAARDTERQRIRRDLHDGLGPALAGVSLGIGAARSRVADDDTAALLERLRGEVDQSLADVRALVSALKPAALEHGGLATALEHHVRSMAERFDGSPRVDWSIDLPQLPVAVEAAAYRIATEALANVARHAEATTVRLDAAVLGDDLVLSVSDDGVGIGENAAGSGVGLASMTQRACDLGGRLTITRGAAGGTVVTASIPTGAAA